jgi:hypothetical protein
MASTARLLDSIDLEEGRWRRPLERREELYKGGVTGTAAPPAADELTNETR